MTIMDILYNVAATRVRQLDATANGARSMLLCVSDTVSRMADEMRDAVATKRDPNANPDTYLDMANKHIEILGQYNINKLVPDARAWGMDAPKFYTMYQTMISKPLDVEIGKIQSEIGELRRAMRRADTNGDDLAIMEYVRQISAKRIRRDNLIYIRDKKESVTRANVLAAEKLVRTGDELHDSYRRCNPKIERAKMELKLATLVHKSNQRK